VLIVRSLRGLRPAGLQHHLYVVLGAGEQLDGPGLAEARPVHLEEDGPRVGLDPEADGDVEDGRQVLHVAALLMMLRMLGAGDVTTPPAITSTLPPPPPPPPPPSPPPPPPPPTIYIITIYNYTIYLITIYNYTIYIITNYI